MVLWGWASLGVRPAPALVETLAGTGVRRCGRLRREREREEESDGEGERDGMGREGRTDGRSPASTF